MAIEMEVTDQRHRAVLLIERIAWLAIAAVVNLVADPILIFDALVLQARVLDGGDSPVARPGLVQVLEHPLGPAPPRCRPRLAAEGTRVEPP